jgi:hypothetical protein
MTAVLIMAVLVAVAFIERSGQAWLEAHVAHKHFED